MLQVVSASSLNGDFGFMSAFAQESADIKLEQLEEENNFNEIIIYTESILEKNPNNEIALEFKSVALWELDEYVEADIFADKTLKINPDNDRALHVKSKSLYKSDKFAEALYYINKAIENNSENYRYYTRKGFILDSLGNYEDAVKSYEQALELKPNSKTALENIGESLMELKRYEEAVSFFNKVLEIDPDDLDTLKNRLFSLSNMPPLSIPFSQFKKYTLEEVGLEMMIPPTFNKTEHSESPILLNFQSFEGMAEFNIIHNYQTLTNIPLEEYVEGSMNIAKEKHGYVDILESEPFSISNIPAHKLVFTTGKGENQKKYLSVFVLQNNALYAPTYYSTPDFFNLHVDSITKIIETMKIKSVEIPFLDYESEQYNFTIQYPANWILLEKEETNSQIVSFTSPYKDRDDNSPDGIIIVSDLDVTKVETIENIVQILEIEYPQSLRNFKMVESFPISLSEIPAHQFIFTATISESYIDPNTIPIFAARDIIDVWNLTMSEDIETKNIQIILIENGIFHVITYRASPDEFDYYLETAKKMINSFQIRGISSQTDSSIPNWIRNNASWWADGTIDDQAFVGGIQFLIKEGVIQIPETTQSATDGSQEIPAWIKNNADWWSQGLISDGDFLKGIQFMVETGIIAV